MSAQHKVYYWEHTEEFHSRSAAYQIANYDHLKETSKIYREIHKEELAVKTKPYRDGRKPEKKAYDAEYRQRPKVKHKRQTRFAIQMATDPQFRIQHTLRGRLWQAIKKIYKTGSAVDDLGCSIPEFKTYFETKFRPGMSWNNHGKGKGKWNIDHIIPMSAFNLEDRQHLILACHYLNLQPLWFEENLSKSDNYPTLDFQIQ